MTIDLDAPATYRQLDPSDMLGHLSKLPGECRKAWLHGLQFQMPESYRDVDKVVVSGMGGSAMGAELARVLLEPVGVPLWVSRDYQPPPFLDSGTLFIASSYSGMTEETLSSFETAASSPAKKLVMTTGGKLADLAKSSSIPTFIFDYASPPRAALAHSFLSLLAILNKLKLLDLATDVDEMVKVLENVQKRIGENSPVSSNPAKELATRMTGKLAVIYGAGVLAPVAHRWKGQINENAKSWAIDETFPELNHNAVVGYEFPVEQAKNTFVVMLRSPSLHPRTLMRYRTTSDLLSRSGIGHQTVDAEGKSPLSQMMSLVLLGDYVSYYMAMLNGVDPTPVKAIDYLKDRLKQG